MTDQEQIEHLRRALRACHTELYERRPAAHGPYLARRVRSINAIVVDALNALPKKED